MDLAISMFKVTPVNLEKVDCSTPYRESALAAMSQQALAVASLAALDGKRAALIERNDQGGSELPVGLEPAVVPGFGRFEQAAAALEAGTVDALLSEQENILAFIADGHAGFRCSTLNVRVSVQVHRLEARDLAPDLVEELEVLAFDRPRGGGFQGDDDG